MKQINETPTKTHGTHLTLISDIAITMRVSKGSGASKSAKKSLKVGIIKMSRRLLTAAAVEITHNG
jgi:hypothetical protein